jgi:A/G-specific adenine glycosylase
VRQKNVEGRGARGEEKGRDLHAARKANALVPALLRWFEQNARNLPWRRTRDPYAIWVSEIMLQQTQVKTVIPYWERWLRELPTIEAAAKASPLKLQKLWEGLGYYTRVRNLQKAARLIVEKHNGKFPENFDAILALPGIGCYTAGAICSIAFNQPKPILDGNVIRVLTRIFGIATDPREKQTNALLWKLAEKLVICAKAQSSQRKSSSPFVSRAPLREENSCSILNQSLMELGAVICRPRLPNCAFCPIRRLCSAQRKGLQEKLPNLGKRTAATRRRFIAFLLERNGKLLVRQRPAGRVNANLWEFPNVEIGPQHSRNPLAAARSLGLQLAATPFCTIKHSITRYRITLEAYRAGLANSYPTTDAVWLTPAQLRQLAFSSAHKKILDRLAKHP